MIWWLGKNRKLLKTLLVLTDCCAIELALPLSVSSGWHTWIVISYTKRGLTSFTAFSVHTFSLQMGFLKILWLMLRLILILFPRTNTLLETIKISFWHNKKLHIVPRQMNSTQAYILCYVIYFVTQETPLDSFHQVN